jgi:hypothetical protein
MNSTVLVGAAMSIPSWYASPGTSPRVSSADSSFKWTGITPHAPCTPACIKKEPMASTTIDVPNAQNGITSNANVIAAIIVTLLPSFSENCPKTIAPTIAPIL